jgi:hypothetical protein
MSFLLFVQYVPLCWGFYHETDSLMLGPPNSVKCQDQFIYLSSRSKYHLSPSFTVHKINHWQADRFTLCGTSFLGYVKYQDWTFLTFSTENVIIFCLDNHPTWHCDVTKAYLRLWCRATWHCDITKAWAQRPLGDKYWGQWPQSWHHKGLW